MLVPNAGRFPAAQVTAAPLSTGRWYLDDANRRNETNPPRSWVPPVTPLYMTKGACGAAHTPVVNVPESARVVEVVLQNLSPTAHVFHLHGMPFKVGNCTGATPAPETSGA